MGVRGLMEKCLSGERVGDTVDLVHDAKDTRNGVEVLVDYYAFQQEVLIDSFSAGLRQSRGNDYLKLSGGEYKTLEKYLSDLIHSLRACNIELVFYIDGSRGSSQDEFDRKHGVWAQRRGLRLDRVEKVLAVCKGNRNINELQPSEIFQPLLIEEQVLSVLRSCECEIHQCPVGDADLLIANELNRRPRAVAVLSNDTDFCVMKGCKLILFQHFDIGKSLRIGSSVDVPDHIRELQVKIVTSEHLIELFRLEDHNMLVELSIVLGNDFTRKFMGRFHHHLDIEGPKIPDTYAAWIREKRYIEKSVYLSQKMTDDREFRQAVEDSRGYFSLDQQPEKPDIRDETTRILVEGIKKLQYRVKMMPIHNGIYFGPTLAAEAGADGRSSEEALLPIRKIIYQMVCPVNQTVKEYDVKLDHPTLVQNEKTAEVPDLATVAGRQGLEENTRDFHDIMNKIFGGNGNGHDSWFEKYSITDGLVIYMMRYFLHLNWQQNINITENEFLALMVMVLDSSRVEEFQQMAVRPSLKCVRIFTWLQNVYRHLHLLGSLFDLTSRFPAPSLLFSGAAWAVLYTTCDDAHCSQQETGLTVDTDVLRKYMNSVLDNKFDKVEDIVKGCVSPRRRFYGSSDRITNK